MIDPKYRLLTKEQYTKLKKDRQKLRIFVNAWANWVRYDLGVNAVPGKWRLIDKELKFIPSYDWKDWQDNPVPEKLHQQWLDNGDFDGGIAAILGKVFHRPDKVEWYLSQVDIDNALAIEEQIKRIGDKSLSDYGKRGLVTQHTD